MGSDDDNLFRVSFDRDGILGLCLLFDLKMENAPEFFEGFEATYNEQSTVVIDFSKIRFIDSSGVGMLLKCAHIVRGNGGVFQILGLNRSLLSVFKLAGLFKIFELLEEPQARDSYPEFF